MSQLECIAVHGGWIYHGGPLSSPVLVSDPTQWALNETNSAFGHAWRAPAECENAGKILAAIQQLQLEIRTMSTTISGEIDAATASLQADLATLTTDVTHLETELAAALAGVTPGSTVTQAQVDALTAVHTSFAALAASIPQVAPTPTPEPPTPAAA
jgi:hypothetical protein